MELEMGICTLYFPISSWIPEKCCQEKPERENKKLKGRTRGSCCLPAVTVSDFPPPPWMVSCSGDESQFPHSQNQLHQSLPKAPSGQCSLPRGLRTRCTELSSSSVGNTSQPISLRCFRLYHKGPWYRLDSSMRGVTLCLWDLCQVLEDLLPSP